MVNEMFNTYAYSLSARDLERRCNYINANLKSFIIVTASIKNRRAVSKLMKGVKWCHNIEEADRWIGGKNIVCSYNTLTHLMYKADDEILGEYRIVLLNPSELLGNVEVSGEDFNIGISNEYFCISGDKIQWLKNDYVGRWTGFRILCENNLLRILNGVLICESSMLIEHDVKDLRKFYKHKKLFKKPLTKHK